MAFLSNEPVRSEVGTSLKGSETSVVRSHTYLDSVFLHALQYGEAAGSAKSSTETLRPSKRKLGSRRSIVSMFVRSSDSQISKHGTSRASTPRAIQSPPRAPTMSPTLWRTSHPSTASLVSESGSEDLSTYRTNLARFKSERAERVAELGLQIPDLSYTDLSPVDTRSPGEESPGRNSVASFNRSMRAYWGGGSTSESTVVLVTDRSSKELDLMFDEKADREALKDWWDRLGTEAHNAYAMRRA